MAGRRHRQPEPRYPSLALSPVDELVPVLVVWEGGAREWHAVYCPRRRMLAGPVSGMQRLRLQEDFELLLGEDGTRHLRPAHTGQAAVCGTPLVGDPLPFHHPRHYPGMPEPDPDPPPVDLFAEWADGTACRRCLVITLAAT